MKKFYFIIIFISIALSSKSQFGKPNVISDSLTYISEVFTVDLDGDGIKDILCDHQGNTTPGGLYDTIIWFKNFGNGNFSSKKIITDSAKYISYYVSEDIDNDGDFDIIYTSYSEDKVYLLKNNGLGVFGKQKLLADSIDTPNGISFIDLDSDTIKDLIISSEYGEKIVWYKNLGLENFSNERLILDSVSRPSLGSLMGYDIDEDGDEDILVSARFDNKIIWIENHGTGVFSGKNVISDSAYYASRIIFADMDMDGKKDIIYNSYNNQIFYKKSLGGGLFGNQIKILISPTYFDRPSFAIDDVDGDNDLDIITHEPVSNKKVVWIENLGSSNFSSSYFLMDSLSDNGSLATLDIDNDGDSDILIADRYNNRLIWLENYFVSPNKIIGEIYFDENKNGIKDSLDFGLNFIKIHVSPKSLASFTSPNGNYRFALDTGNYIVSPSLIPNWNLTSDSSSFFVKIDSTNTVIDSLNFGFHPDSIFNSIQTSLTGGFPRCNTLVNFWADIRNIGTTFPSGIVHMILDDSVTFITSDLTPDSIIGKNIYWHYDSLFYFGNKKINMSVSLPDFNSIGDTMISVLFTHELDSSNSIIHSSNDSLIQILRCAWDPNDKTVIPYGSGIEGFIQQNELLEYTIRFQNTGNDTAINVKIIDQLDKNINWDSLKPISSSHPVKIRIETDGEVIFEFNNIMLPDSNIDYLGSQGYIKFIIDQNQDLTPYTKIKNRANIYFDHNPAITTNQVLNTIKCYSIPKPVLSFNSPYLFSSLNGNYTYQWYYNDSILIGSTTDTIEPFKSGSYFLSITDSNGCQENSSNYLHHATTILEKERLKMSIYPNPFNESTAIRFNDALHGNYDIIIYDVIGKEVKTFRKVTEAMVEINKNEIGRGVFFVKVVNVTSGEYIFVERIIAH